MEVKINEVLSAQFFLQHGSYVSGEWYSINLSAAAYMAEEPRKTPTSTMMIEGTQ